jgi:Lrp/AsnC family leucine-responsive transcriptional regulator
MPLKNLDEIDFKILFHLQRNARISIQEISEKIDLSPSAVGVRVKQLEEDGYIKNYQAILNIPKMNRKLVSFTGISLQENCNYNLVSFLELVKGMPEVCNCYHISGMFDFLLHIAVKDMQDYHDCLVNTLCTLDCIKEVRTFFVLDESGAD